MPGGKSPVNWGRMDSLGHRCVRDEGKDRAYCERFYADYGAATGNRGPLFYDLPECEAAFDYQNSQRRSSR